MDQPLTRHLIVRGTVQGVGYRAGFAARARQLGVRGWVRNRSDGSVEAVVWGSADRVLQITEWARNGPRAAHVQTLQITDREDTSACGSQFEILPTH